MLFCALPNSGFTRFFNMKCVSRYKLFTTKALIMNKNKLIVKKMVKSRNKREGVLSCLFEY